LTSASYSGSATERRTSIWAARWKVVDDRDVVAARHERLDHVRADEARAPCHHRSHENGILRAA
jgi:hypothetical protein